MTVTGHIITVAIAASVGAILMPAVILFGIKTNWRQLGRVMANHRQDARFYRHFAYFGAAIGALALTAMPILDAHGIKDPWYGLTLMAVIAVPALGLVASLKRSRLEG